MDIVRMYNEEFKIDRVTMAGYDKVLKKIEPLICDYARKFFFGDMEYEDRKQEIYMIAIHGINNFNPNRGTKLSSFLHTHIRNKIISKIKSLNKKSNNASRYFGDESGYLKEIPLSFLYNKGTTSNPALEPVDSSDLLSFSDEGFMLEEIESNLGQTEVKIACLLRDGMTIESIGEELDMDAWKVTSTIKKMRKSKLFINYAKCY